MGKVFVSLYNFIESCFQKTLPNQVSLFNRYWFALKYGCQAAFKQKSSGDVSETDHPNFIQKQAIDVMTDINMLRIFKTFLETTPQLFVQIYVLMEHNNHNFSQCESFFLYDLKVESFTKKYSSCYCIKI